MSIKEMRYDNRTIADTVQNLQNAVDTIQQLPSSILAARLKENHELRERKRRLEALFEKIYDFNGSKRVDELENELKRANDKISSTIVEKDAAIKLLESESDRYISIFDELTEEHLKRHSAIKLLEGERDGLITVVHEKSTIIENMRATIAKLDFYRTEFDMLHNMVHEKSEQCKDLNARISARDNELCSFITKYDVLNTGISEKDAEILRLSALVTELQTVRDSSIKTDDEDILDSFNGMKEDVLNIVGEDE